MVEDKELELVSPLPLDECRKRLVKAMDVTWAVFGSKPVFGQLKGSELNIWTRTPGNSFQKRLHVELVQQDDTTRIIIRDFSMPIFNLIYVSVFGVVFVLFSTGLAIKSLAVLAGEGMHAPVGIWLELLISVGWIGGFFFMVRAAQRVGRRDYQFLVEFVCGTLLTSMASADIPSQTSVGL